MVYANPKQEFPQFKLRRRTLEEWVLAYSTEGDLLKVIDLGPRGKAVQNGRTKEIFIVCKEDNGGSSH